MKAIPFALTFFHRLVLAIIVAMLLAAVFSGCKLLDQASWNAGVKVNPDHSVELSIGKSPLPKPQP